MVAFALGVRALEIQDASWIHGLKLAAAAVVLAAVLQLRRALAPTSPWQCSSRCCGACRRGPWWLPRPQGPWCSDR
jgi:hypothetical protein